MHLSCLQRRVQVARLVWRSQDLYSSVGRPLNPGRKYLKRNRAGSLGSGRSASRPIQKESSPHERGGVFKVQPQAALWSTPFRAERD